MKAIKNYGKKTKKLIRLAVAVKSLTATIGASVYFTENKDAAFVILIIGAVLNEVINFLGNDEKIDNISDINSNSSVN